MPSASARHPRTGGRGSGFSAASFSGTRLAMSVSTMLRVSHNARPCTAPVSAPMTDSCADKGTISVLLVKEALAEWRRRGHDEASLLMQAGIPPELVTKPFARVSSHHYGQLWLLIAQAMDDEFFGMNVRRMKSGTFAYMTLSLIHI